MNLNQQISQLNQFRQSLYNVFTTSADVLMNMIDALCSNTSATSVVELSLSPAFERGYSALFKGIANFHQAPSRKQQKPQFDELKSAAKKVGTQSEATQEPPKAASGPPATQEPPKAASGPSATQEPPPAASGPSATQEPPKAANGPSATQEPPKAANGPSASLQPSDAPSNAQSVKQPEAFTQSEQSHQSNSRSPEELAAIMLADRQARARLEHQLLVITVPYLPQPVKRSFYLFGLDVTSQPRQFSPTGFRRGFVYHPNAIKGNKPVTIGHQYSLLAYLPEKKERPTSSWIVPLSTRRVATDQDKELIGMEQLELVMDDEELPFHNQLSVLVGDTSYSKRAFLAAGSQFDNLVITARVRGNRTFYQKYNGTDKSKKGHPIWYGERFSLNEPQTWHEPDEIAETIFTSRRGNQFVIKIEAWENMLMKGRDGIKMHKHPFRLLRIRTFNKKGEPAFKNDLWLIVVGKQRQKLSLLDIYEAYRQRYDLEHYFRFGKQKLLMTAFQTPEVYREENWWQIVQLAYTQLWLAQPLALEMPRPWEKYLPKREGQMASPSTVQRDFGRIIRQLGTPANPPKVRHKGVGRAKGKTLVPRPRPKVVKKGKKSQSNQLATSQN